MTVTMDNPPRSAAPRPTGVNGWLVIGSIITILVIAFGALSVVGWLGYRTETQTQVYQQPVTEISVNLNTGNLTLVPGADNAIRVTRRLHWSFTRPTFNERWDGQQLVVTETCGGGYFMPGPACGVDYSLEVPAGISVHARTDTGDLSVRDIHGSIDLRSSTGDVTANGVVGDLTLQTDTGDAYGTGSPSQVDASTNTGDVTLQLTASPQTVSARSDTGDVTITVPHGDAYKVQASTDTGDVNVTVERSDSATRAITATTDTGDVDISYL